MSTTPQVRHLVRQRGQVLTISPKATAQQAAELMRTHRVGCLVVPDGLGRLGGVISERDIVRHVVAGGLDPADVTVEKIMTRDVVRCGLSTPVAEAQAMMVRHSIRHLPVVDDGMAIGMVSARDVFAYELRATRAALQQHRRTLRELERTHPGIGRADRSDDGMVVIDDGADDTPSLLG